jgi:hypothetical protein
MNIKILIICFTILFIMAKCNSNQNKNSVYTLIEFRPRFDDSNNLMLPLINMVGGELHDYTAQINSTLLMVSYKDSIMYKAELQEKDNKLKTSDNTYDVLKDPNRLILINHNNDSIIFQHN